MTKKISQKKKLESEVAELKDKVAKLENALKEAAHHATPWESIKGWFKEAV
jgi:septal ring factor EnvC (AmiA/AmiB activator)